MIHYIFLNDRYYTMDRINRIFEAQMGMPYKTWHRTVFCKAERHQHDSEKAKKAYEEALRILELYEEFEVRIKLKK
jgi:hypothetical protein